MTPPAGRPRRSAFHAGRLAVLMRACAAITLALLALVSASPVAGHAQLVSVDPPDGSLLETGPIEVRVAFSEPVGLAVGGLQVIDASGASVDVGDDVVDGSVVTQALPELPDGWYVVTWGIISEDGHIVRAASLFGVGDVDAAVRPSADVPEASALVVGPARGVMDLALLVAVGAWIAWWLLGARTVRVRQLAVLASIVALVGSIAWTGAQWLDGGAAWWATPAAPAAVLRLIALVIGLATARRWPMVSAATTVLALLTVVGGGHTATTALGSVLVMIHLVAASAWLGGGPAVLLVLTDRSLSEERALAVVRRFSTLAPLVLVTVGVAGLLVAVILTDGFASGLTTPYTLLLAAKVGLVAAAASIGFLARRRLRGAPTRSTMRRVFIVDAVLLPLIVAASAGLTLTGPHAADAGVTGDGRDGTVASCTIVAEPVRLSLVAKPGLAGRNELRIEGIPPTALEVGIEMAHPATSGAPISTAAERQDDAWVAAAVLPLVGAWDATVAVRLDTFTQVRGTCPITLGHGQGGAQPPGPAMRVSGAWARATTVPGLASAVYLVISNDTDVDDALVGASSPDAATVELHRTTTDSDGTMAMGPVDEVPVPARGTAVLEPGGYHMMLVDPAAPLVTGAVVDVTLTFTGGPPQTVSVPVRAAAPAMDGHGHGG